MLIMLCCCYALLSSKQLGNEDFHRLRWSNMNPFFYPRGKNGDSPLVINSDFWESHFLSGEKTGAGFQPWPGLAQAGLSGEKTDAPDRARSGIRAGPGSPAKITKHQENIRKTKDSGKC